MRTLVIDPEPSGHCAFYLSLIAGALAEDQLHLLTPSDDGDTAAHFSRRGLSLSSYPTFAPRSTRPAEVIAHAAEIVREHAIERVFFNYLDAYLQPLLTAAEPFPCPVTGIWFHPYPLDRRYRWLPPLDKRLRFRGGIHRKLRAVPNRLKLERLYFLDPESPQKLARINPAIPATVLPDPWEKTPALTQAAARKRFHLPSDRTIFLHIGTSEKRKGLPDTIATFDALSRDPVMKDRIFLLRVGENQRLSSQHQALLASLTEKGLAHVIDHHVPERDFMEYFAAADWVLLPYRNFRFSSGILSNAIGAGKPVIAPDHGFIGKTVREQNLGLLFRHASFTDLARTITRAIEIDRSPISPPLREALAPERFIRILRDACLTP